LFASFIIVTNFLRIFHCEVFQEKIWGLSKVGQSVRKYALNNDGFRMFGYRLRLK